jgi:outer membrane receptor protein involved in Fe transport
MQRTIFFIAALILTAFAPVLAQMPGGGAPPPGGFDPSKMNVGRFYGKVVDESGKGVGYATVQLNGKKFDPDTKQLKDTLWAGQLTEANGDFNLEKLPVVGEYTLVISFLGYTEVRQTVSFGIKPPAPGAKPGGGMPGGGIPGGGFPGAGGANFDKDLGNIRLMEGVTALKEITVSGKASTTTLSLDRKTYRVDKDLSTAGGTAQDALKNVPSLSVDLDGNVALRNGSPQIFVDGKPTTLSLDQIAADAIESVEVITNPSAKFDAGGGAAGIVNIVLKKERRIGYNGNVRAGTDSKGGFNFGGDLNARGSKVNVFGSAMLNRNKGDGEGNTFRQNLFGEPLSNITQVSRTKMNGTFANVRAGVDFFLDNRNTLTLSGNFMRGHFQPADEITTTTDFLLPDDGIVSNSYLRSSNQDRNFRNMGLSAQFKHLFPKKGAEWTADVNYNRVKFHGGSTYSTQYDTGVESLEQQNGAGHGGFFTVQSDFVNPIDDKTKIEGGIKATLRDNRNDNMSSYFNAAENVWTPVSQLSDHYKFNDDVFAAYLQGSRQYGKWGIQAGLRAESSYYKGALTDRDSSFTIVYPVSLFPSVFVTRKINESDQIQLAYTRRVNRPNFFQTMPFTDFSDSLNLRRGNPALLPEFTNSVELSYQKVFSKGHNLLVSVYYKQATDLIASYQFTEYNAELNKEVIITSFANSNKAAAYGAEITLKDNFFKWLDLTTNVNLYQSDVDATNVESSLKVSRLSGFLKETVQVKLPAGFAFQVNGEYRTKTSFTPVTNNDPFRPGGPPSQNTAQGYSNSYWFVDASLRKDFWKNQASLTLSMQDVFASRKMGTYTETGFFTQETERFMNPQMVRLNFSYRFGKMDTSLFTRKNTRMNTQGTDMM